MFDVYIVEDKVNSLNAISLAIESELSSVEKTYLITKKMMAHDNEKYNFFSSEDGDENINEVTIKKSGFKDRIKKILESIKKFFIWLKDSFLNIFKRFTFNTELVSKNSAFRSSFFLEGCESYNDLKQKGIENSGRIIRHCMCTYAFELAFAGDRDYISEIEKIVTSFGESINSYKKVLFEDTMQSYIMSDDESLKPYEIIFENLSRVSSLFSKSSGWNDVRSNIEGLVDVTSNTAMYGGDNGLRGLQRTVKELSNIMNNIGIRLRFLKEGFVGDAYDRSTGKIKNDLCTFKKIPNTQLDNFKYKKDKIIKIFSNGVDLFRPIIDKISKELNNDEEFDKVIRGHLKWISLYRRMSNEIMKFIRNFFGAILETCNRLNNNKFFDIDNPANHTV